MTRTLALLALTLLAAPAFAAAEPEPQRVRYTLGAGMPLPELGGTGVSCVAVREHTVSVWTPGERIVIDQAHALAGGYGGACLLAAPGERVVDVVDHLGDAPSYEWFLAARDTSGACGSGTHRGPLTLDVPEGCTLVEIRPIASAGGWIALR